jgi:hypothetical protein
MGPSGPENPAMADIPILEVVRKALEAQREAAMNEAKAFSEQLERERTQLAEEKEKFEIEKAAWNEATGLAKAILENRDVVVTLDVGGMAFKTSIETMASKKGSLFAALVATEARRYYFIDRDPMYFPHILNILRGARVPEGVLKEPGFIDELKFYGLETPMPPTKVTTPALDVINIFGELARRYKISPGCREDLVNAGVVDIYISRHGNPGHHPCRLIDTGIYCNIESSFKIKGPMSFTVRFKKGIRVCPTRYGFASNEDKKPYNWNFEGSNDDETWTILREHKEEEGYPDRFKVTKNGWTVEAKGVFFKYFRILSTGPVKNNSAGPDYWPLSLGCLEILGLLEQEDS